MGSPDSVLRRAADVAPAELRTARLVLRAVAPADETALVALWNDPDVGRYLWDGRPAPPARVRTQIVDSCQAFAAGGIGLYTVRLAKASDAMVGAVGFAGADPPNLASFRVMERLGMTYERTATVGELPVPYFVIRRPGGAKAGRRAEASDSP